jgi:hypothetical protein
MGKNDYLAKQRAMQQGFLDVGEQFGMQKMWDYVQIGLRNTKVTGAVPFGRGQFERLYAFIKECADEYHIAFTLDVEADYMQEKMDTNLREIWGDDLVPFCERYPELKKIDYGKSKKGWK